MTHDLSSTQPISPANHPHYRVPCYTHSSPRTMTLEKSREGVHSVQVAKSRNVDFFAKISPARTLFVSLHGAVTAKPAIGRYPRFWRVSSMRQRVDAFIAVADPTLTLSDSDGFSLGWYTGGQDWDPIDDIAEVVLKVQQHVGASRVMFLGGSGGGFAALRFATRFPGSIAFVQDPQTRVAAYYQAHKRRLGEAAWPGREYAEVLETRRERFDMCWLYREVDPDCFFYYRQSLTDRMHLERHARPFEAAVRGTAGSAEGRFRFAYEEGEVLGHGKITSREFDFHFKQAMDHWAGTSSK